MLILEQISLKAKALTVFRQLLDDAVIKAFLEMIDIHEKGGTLRLEKYACFTHLLFQSNENFTDYVWSCIVSDENTYIRKCSNRQPVSTMLKQTVNHELRTLQEISQMTQSKRAQC